jgi:hypothetical protein
MRATPVDPACGAFTCGNRYHDHLGKVTLVADMPTGWDGRDDYYPNGKPQAAQHATRYAKPARAKVQPRMAVVYAWETMVAQAGAQAASEMFRRVAAARRQDGDQLAKKHCLAGYVHAA